MSRLLRLLAALSLAVPAAAANAQDLEPPRLVESGRVAYPLKARRQGVEGTALVRVHVGENGAASQVVLQRSAGHDLLDAEALRIAQEARFAPARRDGQPVAAWVSLPVRFELRDEPPREAK